MGFYFRKSKSVGPFRLNFSKSGIGLSTGVKGARLSFGPRGTYVNVGRNGIYYRKKIGGTASHNNRKSVGYLGSRNRVNSYRENPIPSMGYQSQQIDTLNIQDNREFETDFGKNVRTDITRARIVFWLWLIATFVLFYYIEMWAIGLAILVRLVFSNFFVAKISYDLDERAASEWEKFNDIVTGLKNSNKLWIVEGETYNSNRKVNAGAGRNITRSDARIKKVRAGWRSKFRVKADVPTVIVAGSKCDILFLPSDVIVKKGLKNYVYSYNLLNVFSSTTNFIEHTAPARDAEIIRRTWQYVNRDGSPDRRYKNNRQYPVCRYGVLYLRSGNELNLEIQTSNNSVVLNVENMYKHYCMFLSSLNRRSIDATSRTRVKADGDYNSAMNGLLKEANSIVAEAGESAIDVMETVMNCKVHIIEGALLKGEGLVLYEADRAVDQRIPRLQSTFNEKIGNQFKFEVVSETRFLAHIQIEHMDAIQNELPLSKQLNDALKLAEEYKNTEKERWSHPFSSIDDAKEYKDAASTGANLFSEEPINPILSDDDQYADLFSSEDSVSDDSKDENDFMNFFDEE